MHLFGHRIDWIQYRIQNQFKIDFFFLFPLIVTFMKHLNSALIVL